MKTAIILTAVTVSLILIYAAYAKVESSNPPTFTQVSGANG